MARIGTGGAAAVALLLAAAFPQAAPAQPAGIAAEAEKLLKASTDFLARQQRFSLDTQSSIDVVLPSGQKIQYDHTVKVSVERPNRLRAERTGDLVDQVFIYDGTSLTLYDPAGKYYASVAAPPTLEEMLDFAREKLDVVAPASDLVYKNAYEILMEHVTEGAVVGKGAVDGVGCDHLAFRTRLVDWQIWIQEGAQPLVRKLVITSRDMLNAPQFTVVAKNWDLAPAFSAETFIFKPSPDLQKLEFLRMGGNGPKAQ